VKKLIILVATLLAVPTAARAQSLNVGALHDDDNVVTVTTGHEHGLVLGAGYARAVPVAERTHVVAGDVMLGWAEVDAGDYRARAGGLAPVIGRGRWRLLAGLGATVRGTENDLGRMTTVGTDATLLGGFYDRRGFGALELGADWAMATYVEHGDLYRMSFPEARDRWLGNAGGLVRAGVQGGASFGRVDLVLRFGRMIETSGAAPLFPMYATLTVDTRW
jgi:hypothetical protein